MFSILHTFILHTVELFHMSLGTLVHPTRIRTCWGRKIKRVALTKHLVLTDKSLFSTRNQTRKYHMRYKS